MSKLSAKVAAVNEANAEAALLLPVLIEVFRPLVGTKILTVNGQFLAKIDKLLPELPHNFNLHVWRYMSNYSLAWTVRTCVQINDHSCLYHETTFYVGNLEGQTLKSLEERPQTFKTDYKEGDIFALRQAYKTAKDVADNALSALYPFGEHDNS